MPKLVGGGGKPGIASVEVRMLRGVGSAGERGGDGEGKGGVIENISYPISSKTFKTSFL